ncbi:MAG: PQQ-binding-like beta-propeller repeat protein [Saprospiraceae bacterium]
MKSILLSLWLLGGTGALAQSTTIAADFTSKPQVRWLFTTSSLFYGSPVVSGDLVYIGGLDSLFHAIQLQTGKEVWQFKTGAGIRSTATVVDELVYLNGGDGNIYCLDRHDGALEWVFQTGSNERYDFADYYDSSPVVVDGLLYAGSSDFNLYAIDAINGSEVWHYPTEGMVHTTPAVADGSVYFGSFDGYVYALDVRTGFLKWKFKTVGHRFFPKGEVQGSPAVIDHLVILGARDYNVYALDLEQGYCHWNKAFQKGWGLSNTMYKDTLYIAGADERMLMSVLPQSGFECWKQPMEFLIFGNLAFSKKLLYVGTTNGKLHAYDRMTGEPLWQFITEDYQEHKLDYFKEDDSYRDDIYSIIKSNEQFLEVECELGGVFSTPVLANDYLLFSSTNGKLYCLEKGQ